MRTKILLVIGAAALVTTALACGGSDSSAPSTTEPSSTTTTAEVAVDPASVAAAPSAGCTTSSPVAPGHTRVDTTQGDAARWYFQDVPTGYVPSEPTPVIIDIHGYSEGAEIHLQQTKLAEYGNQEGFVTVTPQSPSPVSAWDPVTGSADVALIMQILDEVESAVCVDTNRVFVAGFSHGAFMASAIACDDADRIAAIAPVAGIRDPRNCNPSRPVPIVAFHGTEDDFIPFAGGLGSEVSNLPSPDGSGQTLGEVQDKVDPAEFPPIPDIVATWAQRNGCTTPPVTDAVASDVTHFAYPCPPGNDTELYEVTGGGHSWPGSAFSQSIEFAVGHTSMSISANEIMWAFFQQHPLGV